MAEKSQGSAVELKRVVMVKAIVTEAFKVNLVKELERAIGNIENQSSQITERGKAYLEELKKKGLRLNQGSQGYGKFMPGLRDYLFIKILSMICIILKIFL